MDESIKSSYNKRKQQLEKTSYAVLGSCSFLPIFFVYVHMCAHPPPPTHTQLLGFISVSWLKCISLMRFLNGPIISHLLAPCAGKRLESISACNQPRFWSKIYVPKSESTAKSPVLK